MSIQKLGRIKRRIVILMVVGFLLSVTAAAVSAKGTKGAQMAQ